MKDITSQLDPFSDANGPTRSSVTRASDGEVDAAWRMLDMRTRGVYASPGLPEAEEVYLAARR